MARIDAPFSLEQRNGPKSAKLAIALPAPFQQRSQFRNGRSPFKRTPKGLRAIALRDSAASLIQRFGRPRHSANPNRVLGSTTLLPFGSDAVITVSLSVADSKLVEIVQANRAVFPHFMKYGLDIWAERKVFNLEWDDHGTINIVNFTRGPWEDVLIALAEENFR